jgi:hypothetical protein
MVGLSKRMLRTNTTPHRQLIHEKGKGIAELGGNIIFDMQYEVAQVSASHNAGSFQTAEVLSKHLPRSGRDQTLKLADSNRTTAQRTEDLDSPFTKEQDLTCERSTSRVCRFRTLFVGNDGRGIYLIETS